MSNLEGRVAVITGGAQGIGAELAIAMSSAGASVVVSDIKDPGETIDTIKAAGGAAIGCVADITDNESLGNMVALAEETFGPIGVLVNNAGIFSDTRAEALHAAIGRRV